MTPGQELFFWKERAEKAEANVARLTERCDAYREAVAQIGEFDCLPAVNAAMRWPKPPPYDERWMRAVCAAAEIVRNQIAAAIAPPAGEQK